MYSCKGEIILVYFDNENHGYVAPETFSCDTLSYRNQLISRYGIMRRALLGVSDLSTRCQCALLFCFMNHLDYFNYNFNSISFFWCLSVLYLPCPDAPLAAQRIIRVKQRQ